MTLPMSSGLRRLRSAWSGSGRVNAELGRRRALPSRLRELADRAEAGLSLEGGGVETEEQVATLLERGGAGAREGTLFRLRLEARGRAETYRITADELERRGELRWRLMQSLLYPGLLSLLLAVALLVFWFLLGSSGFSSPESQPVEPILYFLLTLVAVLLPASFPLMVWGLSRKRRVPGAHELLLLLREALLTTPSLGLAVRLLRSELRRRGFVWEALDRCEALLLEGATLSEALSPLAPPLTDEELTRIFAYPERTAAISTLSSLIRYRELRSGTLGKSALELLPAAALALVGAELLLIVILVVLPHFEMLLTGGVL